MKHQKAGGNKRNPKPKHIQGAISLTLKGVGFLSHPDFPDDLYIAPHDLNRALHGDIVEVIPSPVRTPDKRVAARVTKIVDRARVHFVGTLKREVRGWVLIPDDRKMYTPIAITPTAKHAPEEGMKALVEITQWESADTLPQGKIHTIIGKSGEHETEMRSIVLGRGFEMVFDPRIEEEAKAIAQNRNLPPEEIAKRRDFRNVPTCTIDPDTAQDFDDALSFQKLPSGEYELGVHIADVSHYVQPGMAMDDEAKKRGTSIYLVDRTIPMLPEVLSNDVCSLNPGEDKLTYAAVFTLNNQGIVTSRWFGRTVIRSDKRFTYEEAQKIIDGEDGPMADNLRTLNTLSKLVREKRFDYGAIDFDQPEVRFRLDAEGKPVDVIRKERLDAHRLIEEFMLLANREVATYVAKLGKKSADMRRAFIYRIHDTPDPERIEDLSIFLRALGYELKTHKGVVTAKELNRLFREIEGTPEESLIKTATIRSMAKAVYSTKNIGHFGLAFQYYTHFTSPIRRYPDVLVHRILTHHLSVHHDGKDRPLSQSEIATYEKIAVESSQREVSAVEAERDSIKMKQAEYLMNKVGEVFEGTISGVAQWGFYVSEKHSLSEGLVRLSSLKDDYYELDQKNYAVVGQKTNRRLRLGDSVRVRLLRASPAERTIDFELVES